MTKSLIKEKDNLKQYVWLKQVSSIGRAYTNQVDQYLSDVETLTQIWQSQTSHLIPE